MSDRMRWSRWGDPADAARLPDSARRLLEAAFGPLAEAPSVRWEDVRVPEPRLPAAVLDELREVAGGERVAVDRRTRLLHTRGKSTPDLLRMRAGDATDAPDAVVHPGGHDDVLAVIAACERHGVALVPYGGGASVVGGLAARRDGYAGAVALDLGRLDRLVRVDLESGTAVLEAGMLGPRAEALLGEHGLTLGHFPQSFEYASIGGFAATRSSGQASSGYGRFDSLVVALQVATPRGTLRLGTAPATAAGPDLRQLLLGSEGAFGVITACTVRVRPRPEAKVYEGWRFASFAEGTSAVRRLVQSGGAPTVLRLSDETETSVNLADPDPDPDHVGAGEGGGCLLGRASRATVRRRTRCGQRCRTGSPASAASPSARARAGRGRTGGSTGRTCATPCSTWGCWRRHWRPRRSGRTCRPCTRP